MKCITCNKDTDNPRFCSKSCAAKYNNKITKVKPKATCVSCGNLLTKKSGKKYCSNRCQGRLKQELINQQILNGEPVRHQQIRRYLIEQHGAKCMLCGWAKENIVTKKVPIELDHIDGDSENNKLSNVRLLCPNCHSVQSTYKALNKGKGRFTRRLRYSQGKSF